MESFHRGTWLLLWAAARILGATMRTSAQFQNSCRSSYMRKLGAQLQIERCTAGPDICSVARQVLTLEVHSNIATIKCASVCWRICIKYNASCILKQRVLCTTHVILSQTHPWNRLVHHRRVIQLVLHPMLTRRVYGASYNMIHSLCNIGAKPGLPVSHSLLSSSLILLSHTVLALASG